MAIQMTRAEYEAKYGSKPVFSSSTLDTTPAPIRMTRAEYNEIYGIKPEKTALQNASQDIQETKQGISSTMQEGSQLRADTRNRFMQGEINAPESIYQQGGNIINTGFNVAFEALKGAAKTLLPESAEKGTANFIKGFMERGSEYNKKFVEDTMTTGEPEEKQALQTILSEKEKYDTDPNYKANVDATLGYLGLVTGPKGTKAVAGKAADTIGDATTASLKAAKEFTEPVVKKFDDRALNNVVKELAAVEDKYAPIRKANTYSPDVEASRIRIAQSNVLENAVDTNGILRTEDAVKAYKAQTIDGVEDVVRKLLDNEKKTINLNEIRNALKTEMFKAGLEGADLVTAVKGIEKQIDGLKLRANEFGDIPLTKLQDAKISTTKQINFQTPPETATYRKAIARTYKTLIEEKSGANVKEINKELAKYYRDIERLEKLDGRRVEGGRLGKYTASLAGTAIGMGAGSVGGGLGAAVGGIIGGEAAQALKGSAMARTFKKGVKGSVPENQTLKGAAEKAKEGVVKNLKVPDKKVGAPASIKKTKEITKTEALIAKNVEAQKKAIKAGDFTLVATLKDVYENLVEKLKKLVREVVESAKNPTIGLSTKDVTKNVHPEDKAVMRAFINDVRIKKPMTPTAEKLVDKLFERFGIDPDMDANRIADKFQRILEKNTTKAKESNPTKSTALLEEAKKYKSAEYLSSGEGQPVSTTLANFIGKNAKSFNTQGSFEALDGMVRNQINASLKMKPLFDDIVENRATGNKSWAQFVPLRELVDYPELFTAYPSAKNIRVSFMDMGKNDFGSFYLDDRGVPTINLNRSKKDATQTLKHEIQHFIQAKEGFSLGGNPDVLFRADVQNQVLKQQLRNVIRDKEIYQNATIGDMEYIKSAIEKTGRGEKLTTKEIEDFFGDEKEFNDLAMKTYKHLHGEWEAEANSIEELLKVKSPIFGKSKK